LPEAAAELADFSRQHKPAWLQGVGRTYPDRSEEASVAATLVYFTLFGLRDGNPGDEEMARRLAAGYWACYGNPKIFKCPNGIDVTTGQAYQCTMTRCPSPAELPQWLADEVIGPEAEAVEAHIEGCAACQQALEELTGNAGARTVPEPECRDESGGDFLRRLEQTPPAGGGHRLQGPPPPAAR
jgi:hypothetical protein